jgi:hypothetical protein
MVDYPETIRYNVKGNIISLEIAIDRNISNNHVTQLDIIYG